MNVRHCTDLQTFYDHVAPFLQQREAEHNALLAYLSDLLREPPDATTYSYMGYVETEAGEIVAVAHGLGHRLMVAHPAEGYGEALDRLLHDAASPNITRLLVPTEFDERLQSVWLDRVGARPIPHLSMRIYRLENVILPANFAGTLRWATSEDRALVRQWMIGFDVDAFGANPDEVNEAHLTDWMTSYLDSDVYGIAFWDVNGEPVSMAATVGRSPTGMRVGLVYTPPEQRGHGYASMITAALSQHLLDSGLQFCTLATDLSNQTSNKIYQAIGYMPVADQTTYDVVLEHS